eukprot:305587_1
MSYTLKNCEIFILIKMGIMQLDLSLLLSCMLLTYLSGDTIWDDPFNSTNGVYTNWKVGGTQGILSAPINSNQCPNLVYCWSIGRNSEIIYMFSTINYHNITFGYRISASHLESDPDECNTYYSVNNGTIWTRIYKFTSNSATYAFTVKLPLTADYCYWSDLIVEGIAYTSSPTFATTFPTLYPTTSNPTSNPTFLPTSNPTFLPTSNPVTGIPTSVPTVIPTWNEGNVHDITHNTHDEEYNGNRKPASQHNTILYVIALVLITVLIFVAFIIVYVKRNRNRNRNRKMRNDKNILVSTDIHTVNENIKIDKIIETDDKTETMDMIISGDDVTSGDFEQETNVINEVQMIGMEIIGDDITSGGLLQEVNTEKDANTYISHAINKKEIIITENVTMGANEEGVQLEDNLTANDEFVINESETRK